VSGVARAVPRADVGRPLGSVLRDAGYEEGRIHEAIGADGRLGRGAAFALAGLRSGRLATLGALFLAGAAVPEGAAAAALAPLKIDELEADGLAVRGPEGVRATVRVEEYQGVLVASDRDDAHPADDYVLEVGPSSRAAAALTVRKPVDRALDPCSGNGVQALLLRAHAANVVATEISPRAVGFARFNAELNGLDAIDWRLGNLLEPVEGESFGVITCNPPFVIGPGGEPLYRDARRPADEVSRTVAAGAARLLEEGGFATVVCNWISRKDEPWHKPPERWLDGSGCDLLLLRLSTEEALDYAAGWSAGVLQREGQDAYVAAVERHRDHLAELGAEKVTAGVIVLRRRNGPVWRRREILSTAPRGSGSAQLLRIFEAEDFLVGLGDERDLLDEVLEPAPGARLVGSLRYAEGGYVPRVAQMALDEGIGLDGRISVAAAPAVERLDGRSTLREVLGDSAEGTLPAVRELFARGFLRRCGPPA
jgi:methylase of polypeptide subunit release factors